MPTSIWPLQYAHLLQLCASALLLGPVSQQLRLSRVFQTQALAVAVGYHWDAQAEKIF